MRVEWDSRGRERTNFVKMLHFLNEVTLQHKSDVRGDIGIFEILDNIPFQVKRFYYIAKVPKNAVRGAHAHKSLEQIFFSLNGSFKLQVTDGILKDKVELSEFGPGYHLSSGYWRELSDFTEGAVCLVLASDHYKPHDYIYDLEEFKVWRANLAKH